MLACYPGRSLTLATRKVDISFLAMDYHYCGIVEMRGVHDQQGVHVSIRMDQTARCSAANQFPRRMPSFFTLFTRRIPAAKSTLEKTAVGSLVCQATHGAKT